MRMRYERYQSPYLQSAAQVKVDTSFRKSLILLTMDCPLKQVINSRIPAAVNITRSTVHTSLSVI